MTPTNHIEYVLIVKNGMAKFRECIICKRPFSPANTFTKSGWQETQISGFCEACFDELFEELDDGDDYAL